MIDKVKVIVKIYYLMHLIKCPDNLTCCYIDLLWLNSNNTGYYIIHFLEQFILLHYNPEIQVDNDCLDRKIQYTI